MIVEANGRKHFWVFLFAVLSLSQGPEQKNKCADESVVPPSYIEECATTSAPPTSSCPFPPLMDTHPQWVPRLLFHFYENEPHLLCVCALIYRVITASREKKKFCRRISWRTGTASPVPIVLTGPVDEALHLFSCVNGHLDWLLDRPFKRLEHGGLSSWHPIECPTQCWTPPCRGKCPIYGLCVVFGMNHQIVTGRGDSRLSLTGKLLSRYLWSYQCRVFSRRKDKQATN